MSLLTNSIKHYRIYTQMKASNTERDRIIKKLRTLLSEEKGIYFAFIHGSFLSGADFKDIDIAVYLDASTLKKIDSIEYELKSSIRLEKYIDNPIDVKILNEAPLGFRYHSTRGYLLFSHDELIREEFLCRTWSEYFDFKPVSKIYIKEVARA